MKPLAERVMAIVGYCKQHPDMRAAGYVSLILNRSDERVEELEVVLRELLSASIEVMVEQQVEDARLRAANSEAMRVLQEGGK